MSDPFDTPAKREALPEAAGFSKTGRPSVKGHQVKQSVQLKALKESTIKQAGGVGSILEVPAV